MKKIFIAFVAMAVGFFAISCGTTTSVDKASSNAEKGASAKTVMRERIDWKGAGVGADVPDWVVAATEDDFEGLPADMQKRLDGKFYLIMTTERVRKEVGSTKDLKMAQEAAAAGYMVNIARSLNAAVDARFSGVLSANEDSQKTLMATAANARFTGFTRVADSWVLLRVNDLLAQKVTDIYTVVQIYACDQNLWQKQAANYIREFAKENPDSADMQKAAAMADDIAVSIKPNRVKATD